MARKGTYYLGRVVKLGSLEQEHIRTALKNPNNIIRYGCAWTFLDVEELKDNNSVFYFGRLVKYDPDAEVHIVDPVHRIEVRRSEPNLTSASSPFVYIPNHSGIAFLHISSHIEHQTFMNRWAEIINTSHKDILSKCEIDPITDLRTFARRLRQLEGIYKISATVSPPNPLFGPLWENLKNYLNERQTNRLTIQETNSETALNTSLVDYVDKVMNLPDSQLKTHKPLPIGDAAILMSADGYGKGYIKGKRDSTLVTIRTSESVRNFQFDRDPEPENLYRISLKIFEQIEKERRMEHQPHDF